MHENGGVTPRVSSTTFVGRRRELARLEEAWKSAVNDEVASTVLIGGEAGVGKTRLVAELISRLGEPALVLTGQCTELVDRALPFGPIVLALRQLHRSLDQVTLDAVVGSAGEELSALMPELHAPRPGEIVRSGAIFEQILGLLERLGDRVPTLLVLEDLHWADQSTRHVLSFLARNLQHARVVVLGTFRSDDLHRRHPLRTALAEMDRSGAAVRIDLEPFDFDEANELIREMLGDAVAPGLVDRLFARSDGNAFFVEELVAAHASHTNAMDASLRDILLARIDALPDNTQHVLRCASVIGRNLDHRLLAATAELPAAELMVALRDAAEHQVLVTDADGLEYRFRHALVHEAVYDELLPGDRVMLHTRVATLLAEHPDWFDGPEAQLDSELACHWDAARNAPHALTSALAAARAAAGMYAHGEALAHTERALGLWPQVPDAEELAGMRHVDVMRAAAIEAELGGDSDRALDFAEAALREVDAATDPVTAGLLNDRIARNLWVLQRGRAEILEHCRLAVALVGDEVSPARARVLATYGQHLMLFGLSEAIPVCEAAIKVAQEVGDRVIEGHARNSLGSTLAGIGRFDEGIAQLQVARSIALELHAWDDAARAYVNEGGALQNIGRLEEALALSVEGADLARAHGLDRSCGSFLRLNAAECLWQMGRWRELEEQLREVEASNPHGVDIWRLASFRSLLAAGHGNYDDARLDAATMGDIVGIEHDEREQIAVARPLVTIDWWSGETAAAADRARTALEIPLDNMRMCIDAGIPTVLDGAGAAADVGDAETARAFDALVAGWMQAERWDGEKPDELDVVQLTTTAEAQRALGRDDAQQWVDVARGWMKHGARPREAYANWRAAEAALRAADRAAATDYARCAAAAAKEIGWVWLRDGVAALARRARLDLGEDAVVSSAERAGLTDRELDVLRLVAVGRTNRQIGQELFISSKTASVHVSNILGKLGVANRGEAAAAARRLGLDGEATPA
jgi:DNA-binding CsgD family transcriptional regulator